MRGGSAHEKRHSKSARRPGWFLQQLRLARGCSRDLFGEGYGFIEPNFTDNGLVRINIFDAMKSDEMSEPARFCGKLANGLYCIGPRSVIVCQDSALVIKGDIVIVNVEIISGH